MPKEHVDAYHKFDRAVDRLYQDKPFETEADRLALLLKRDQAVTEGKG